MKGCVCEQTAQPGRHGLLYKMGLAWPRFSPPSDADVLNEVRRRGNIDVLQTHLPLFLLYLVMMK